MTLINAVVLAVVFPTISAVLIPIGHHTINRNGGTFTRNVGTFTSNVGTSKLERHITLLEKEVQNLRLDLSANRNQLTSVWAQLRVKTDELASVTAEMKTLKDEFRSLLTDIALLKRDHQQLPDRTEIALMKADVDRLKAAPKQPPPPPPPVTHPAMPKPERPPPQDKELETKILKMSFQLNRTISDVQDLRKWREETTAQLKLDKEKTKGDITAIQALTTANKEDVQKAFTNIKSLDKKVMENFTTVASQAKNSDLLTWLNISRVEKDLAKINKNLTLRIDYAGMNVGFQASQKTDNDSEILLKFKEVHYNDGNGYNITTGYFTAPVGGTYLFWLNVVFMNSRGSISIIKGFAILASGYSRLSLPSDTATSSMRHDTATAMAVSHVNKGEHVFFTLGPNAVKTRQEVSHFGGVLVHYDGITILPYKKRK